MSANESESFRDSDTDGIYNDPDVLSSDQAEKALHELLRFILSKFLAVVVNRSLIRCFKPESDETDCPACPILANFNDWDKLFEKPEEISEVFISSARYVKDNYQLNAKNLFEEYRKDIPNNDVNVNVDFILYDCMLEWFMSDFQSATTDLKPSPIVIRALESKPCLDTLIRSTHFITQVREKLIDSEAMVET